MATFHGSLSGVDHAHEILNFRLEVDANHMIRSQNILVHKSASLHEAGYIGHMWYGVTDNLTIKTVYSRRGVDA